MYKGVLLWITLLLLVFVGNSSVITISSCNQELNLSYPLNEYSVNQSLTFSSGNCLNITSDNVKLNCNGHTITGNNFSGSYAIYLNSVSYTNISNCHSRFFERGFYLLNSNYNNISHSTSNFYPGNSWGFRLDSSDYNIFYNVSSSHKAFGYENYIGGSHSNVINYSAFNDNSYGITLWSGNSGMVENFQTNNNSNYGIWINSNDNLIRNGESRNNGEGIRLYTSSGNDIINVNFVSNNNYDIWFRTWDPGNPGTYSINNNFSNNSITNASLVSGNFNFENNTIVGNTYLLNGSGTLCFPPGLEYLCDINPIYSLSVTSQVISTNSIFYNGNIFIALLGIVLYLML